LPNNNLTDALAREESPALLEEHSLYRALTRRRPLAECIIPARLNLGLVPGTPSLARAEVELSKDPGICIRFPVELRALDPSTLCLGQLKIVIAIWQGGPENSQTLVCDRSPLRDIETPRVAGRSEVFQRPAVLFHLPEKLLIAERVVHVVP
jgi:hypothetical protein